MYVDPGTALSVATALYDNRAKIAVLTGKLRYLFSRGVLRIVVFGPGGAGKSTLRRLLSASDKTVLPPATYQESQDQEKYALQGDFVGGLLVPPGQERRLEDYWPDLYRSLAEGKSRGVINVVSWGYHSFQDYS